MPVIIDRKQANAGTGVARTANKTQPSRYNRTLIYGCVAAIVLCWAFIAVQIFGPLFARSSAPTGSVTLPAGIKAMELPGK